MVNFRVVTQQLVTQPTFPLVVRRKSPFYHGRDALPRSFASHNNSFDLTYYYYDILNIK